MITAALSPSFHLLEKGVRTGLTFFSSSFVHILFKWAFLDTVNLMLFPLPFIHVVLKKSSSNSCV